MESAHERSHAQIRKTSNDKAREDRAAATDYQRKKAERRKSWLRSVLKLQNESPDIVFSVENQIPIENKGHEEGLSTLKLQQLQFGSIPTITNTYNSKSFDTLTLANIVSTTNTISSTATPHYDG